MEIYDVAHWLDPARAVRRIAGLPDLLWLDSGYPAAGHSRFDILSACPARRFVARSSAPPAVARFIEQAHAALAALDCPAPDAGLPFQGGLMGYWGYDLYRADFGLPAGASRGVPVAYQGLYLWALIIDHRLQRARLLFHPACPPATRRQVEALLCTADDSGWPGDADFALHSVFAAAESPAQYRAKIAQIQQHILAGDIYQANYAQHFSAHYAGDPLAAYLSQRAQHPAPCSAFLRLDEQAILCHSPEEFMRIDGRDIVSRPIKGTAPRNGDPHRDRRNAAALRASGKERAENLMIVDLLRNDLGQSCEPGSIRVPRLFELQSFANVHHLVSEVRGRLRAGCDPLEVLRRCQPGGSITGAPKRRAMEIIDALEVRPRGIYCGNIGYVSRCGRVQTNIAIRTMLADRGEMHCWGGGGIVADSDPAHEYRETLHKVGPLMRSLEADYLE